MAYDKTTSELVSKQLLLNIGRLRRNQPPHFTNVSSIAATFDFTFNAGIGPAMTGDRGYLPMPSIGGSASENPTITITPMEGGEFAQRLLAPFHEQKLAMLLRQGYDVDALLRLTVAELRVKEKDQEIVHFNRPLDPSGYAMFRRVMAQLSSIQDRHGLYVEALEIPVTHTLAASSVSAENLMTLLREPSLKYDSDKQTYQFTTIITGRIIISNYDPASLTPEERMRLRFESEQGPSNEVLLDIRSDRAGGEVPIHGKLRLRSFFNVLTFIARGIADEVEYDVAPDPRTPVISENPVHALQIVESQHAAKAPELSAYLDDYHYALAPETGYQWNHKSFSLLYQLFQMTVEPAPLAAPAITIAK